MEKIALITDSSCDLTNEYLERYNIKVLPLRLIYTDAEFLDKVNITPAEAYARLVTEIPKTSLPSIEYAESFLTQLEEEGYTHVIAIHISSGLSGTYNSVRLMVENHTTLKSHVFDSKTLGIGEGMIVSEVAKLIDQGESFDNIVKSLPEIQQKISIYYTIDTLEYLKKGGRIGKVSGTIAEMLNIKPIIGVNEDGVYYTHAKARGRKQSINKLTEILNEYLEKHKCNVWVIEGGCFDDATKFLESIKNHKNILNIGISTISPALGVHTGPGLIGLGIQKVT